MKKEKKVVAKKEVKKTSAAPKKAVKKPAKKEEAKVITLKEIPASNEKKPMSRYKKAKMVKAHKEGKRVYHVSKREEDNMWQVKYAYGEKAIKLFKTKAEAEAYTKEMAKNQGGVMLAHNSKGKSKGKISKR